MNARLVTFILLSFSSYCMALEEVKVEGVWEGYSRSISAIFGFIEVTSSEVKWGHDRNNFACVADYKLVSRVTVKDYPDNHASVSENLDHFEVFKLEVRSIDCDFERIGNASIHRNIGFMQFSIPVEKNEGRYSTNYDSAGFNNYDQDGSASGWGIISRTKLGQQE